MPLLSCMCWPDAYFDVFILAKDHYQAFFWVVIDVIVELLGLIIKPFDDQTES